MREDLLHFVWQHLKIPLRLKTTEGETLKILHPGEPNDGTGPDFFNARLLIDRIHWAGNVEMHLRSSDWYAHGHQDDSNYSKVILHVVYEDDMPVTRGDGQLLPTLQLRSYIAPGIINSYRSLLSYQGKDFINCEKMLPGIPPVLLSSWMEELYRRRLTAQSDLLNRQYQLYNKDWEQLLFISLMRVFGSQKNGAFFLEVAGRLDFSIIRKTSGSVQALEALFFGMVGMLSRKPGTDPYYFQLQREFTFLKRKYGMLPPAGRSPEFFGQRPSNFPTIRLAQLAMLYHKTPKLFSETIAIATKKEAYSLFSVAASTYWNTHFLFGKSSRSWTKRVNKRFTDLILLNAVIPLKVAFASQRGKDIRTEMLAFASEIKAEKNGPIEKFKILGVHPGHALQSQALLELYSKYCRKHQCLRCAVGRQLLNQI
ncbi:DUF2851 family protein [Zeaxanthinibacter sp. PT1]|uniref:DUF2851 family protein n=1 Tax=Zeaxanthinibacter TaxID=561554 RepID=UPI00234BB5FD|nr:DUF2851 family protein [Zeaxanthinibacter sp. PT1]MDC6351843.1 DUF2851 family protein [Zeaxanthinibacter sp. PT1]